jgi:WD40 repeat protein
VRGGHCYTRAEAFLTFLTRGDMGTGKRFSTIAALAVFYALGAGCATGPDGKIMDAFPVASVAWSLDGHTIAAGANSKHVVYLLDGREQRIRAVLSGPGGALDLLKLEEGKTGPALAFSPDGRKLATAGLETSVAAQLWDVDTAKELARFPGNHQIRSIAFSPDGRRLAVAGPSTAITVFDVATKASLKKWNAHNTAAITVAYIPGVSALATGGADSTVKIWHSETFEQLGEINDFPGDVTDIVSTPSGRQLATTAAAGRDVRLYDINPGSQSLLDTSARGLIDRSLALPDSVSSGAKAVAITGMLMFGPGFMYLIAPFVIRKTSPPGAPYTLYRCDPRVVVSADGRRVAAIVEDRGLRLYIVDLTTGATVVSEEKLQSCALAISPDGRTLISGGFSAGVRFYDSVKGTRIDKPNP